MKDEAENFVDELILSGAVEVSGVDPSTGELLFTFTQKLAESHPELYQRITDSFHAEIMHLWELGYVEMDPSLTNPIVTITEKGLNAVEVAKLDPQYQLRLGDIIGRLK